MNSPIFWPSVCVSIGFCVLILGIVVWKKLKTSELWPVTDGKIIESTVQPEWVKVGGGNMYVVSPKVVYEYQVDGKKYTSSRLALVESDTANEGIAREKSEKYAVGQQVSVYYNPRKPEFATLETGDPTGGQLPFGMIIVGTIVAIFGIVWLLVKS